MTFNVLFTDLFTAYSGLFRRLLRSLKSKERRNKGTSEWEGMEARMESEEDRKERKKVLPATV